MSKEVKRYDVDLDEAHFCDCGNSSRTIRVELKDGDYVLASAYDALLAERDALLEALKGMLADIDGLIKESEGVAGFHLNGEIAPWSSLEEGGRFERISHATKARAAIAKAEGDRP